MVDEAGLHDLPLDDKPLPLGGAEIADLEGFHAGFAIGQLGFGLACGAVRVNGAVVLGPETLAEGQGLDSAAFNVRGNSNDNDEDEYKRGHQELGSREVIVHSVELTLHCVLLCGDVRGGKGWWGRNRYAIYAKRAGAGMLARIARSELSLQPLASSLSLAESASAAVRRAWFPTLAAKRAARMGHPVL